MKLGQPNVQTRSGLCSLLLREWLTCQSILSRAWLSYKQATTNVFSGKLKLSGCVLMRPRPWREAQELNGGTGWRLRTELTLHGFCP